ncbi:hypothetical protein [Kitasatospora sp. LaBMicrA B282]|uniref:hypothetical protein n=1 Tax=Kitasatospora sp. LaBMicrA B282 TaxID=3420949 RepID=UPI003D0BDEB7
MGLIVLGSAKGAPGVTTCALALAAAWPGEVRPVVAETDVAGGDAMLRFGLPESPGLVSMAAAARRLGLTASLVSEHAQRLPGGVEVVAAPAESAQCTAALGALSPAWARADLAGTLVLADCGRLTTAPGTAEVVGAAGVVVLVSEGAVEALAHTAEVAQRLRGLGRAVVVALVGPCRWPAREVTVALDVSACVMLPRDAVSAALLRGATPPKRRWRPAARYPLLDAACSLAVELERLLHVPVAGSHQPEQLPRTASAVGLATALRGDQG